MQKKQQKMSSNGRNIVPRKEIWVKESNAGVKVFTGNSQIAVSVRVQ